MILKKQFSSLAKSGLEQLIPVWVNLFFRPVAETFDFSLLDGCTYICARDRLGVELKTISDKETIAEIAKVFRENSQGWYSSWSGSPIPLISLQTSENFQTNLQLGISSTYLTAYRGTKRYFKNVEEDTAKKLFQLLNIKLGAD